MADPVSLLPPNATPLMRTLSEVYAEAGQLPAIDLATLWDPQRAPAARLPSLAADVGVMLWKPEWPETKKRNVIARTIALKRRLGTRPAFEEHLRFIGAELVQFRAPPQRAAVRRHRTPEERERWASQFPALDVTQVRIRHRRPGRLVVGRCWGGRRKAAVESPAASFFGARATLTRASVAQPVRIRRVDGHLQAALPDARRRAVAGRPLSRRAWCPRRSTASSRLYAFTFGDRRADTLSPGKPSIEIQAGEHRHLGQRPATVVAGAAFGGRRRFLRSSRAREHVSRSIRLFDPALAASGRLRPRGGMIAGKTVLGQPAFQLRLAVDLKRQKRGRRAWPFSWRGPLRAHDPSRLADGLAAVRAAKLGRDQVLVRTGLYRPIAAGDGVPLDGAYHLGQIVRSL